MAAVKTSAVRQYSLVGSEYSEKVEQLPRGSALHAARTPISKKTAKTSFPKQTTDTVKVSTSVAKLVHNNSTSCNDSSEDTASESVEPEASPNKDSTQKTSNAADLTRRAVRRVNGWKKSEQNRREEEERARQMKLEQDKRRQNHVLHAKQRRRAEIYALNALLRQLQQEKVARYIDAQKQIEEIQEGTSLTTTVALVQVCAVGM